MDQANRAAIKVLTGLKMGKDTPGPGQNPNAAMGAQVQTVDEDRWLAARFAAPEARPRLDTIYSLVFEIARTAEAVSEPALGAIRLQWWRDGIQEVMAGEAVRPHPALQALSEIIDLMRPSAPLFADLIDAREHDLNVQPFRTWPDLEAYVDATAGGVMAIAAGAAAPDLVITAQLRDLLRQAGRVWGYTGLVRALPAWTERRRTFFPEKLMAHVNLSQTELFSGRTSHASSAAARSVLDRATHAQREVRRLMHGAPKDLFPAYGYVALVALYLQAMDRGAPPPGPMSKRLKLVMASATGQV
jgi:phytoene synthase